MPARPMFRSPNKKRNAGSLPTTFETCASVGGVKIYKAGWPFKKSVTKKMDGNKGNRHTKRHENCRAMRGTPSGECLGPDKGKECRCGKHNKQGLKVKFA